MYEPEEEAKEGEEKGSRGMDCCICSPMASKYRLPRNAICASCHEGAKAIIGFLVDKDDEHGEDGGCGSGGLRDAWEQVKEMSAREEETNARADFLQQGFGSAWKEGLHTDILVKPGTGPPIPAHRAILAARSEVFRHMLSGDERCKAPAAAGDSIALPELSHADLSLLLAFLYTGALEHQEEEEEEERRLHAVLVAADKYDVPPLRRACEARLAAGVGPRNALRTMEVAELSSSAALMARAMGAVVEHAEEVVFSDEYAEFASRNAGLCVEITRALLAARVPTTAWRAAEKESSTHRA
ncbi:hypothetical protein U9M48_034532 [Paspalum notatum var. saurae]|uniref:BTB domain-containing protein n=1 Tax=Paspalum notatum var. saurae TaxID=547442 RepID=A0AAQ3UA64_PASNO